MNKKNNSSKQILMIALASLLESKFELQTISVTQLIQVADVSRSTFYRNFENINDFLEWVTSQVEGGMIQNITFKSLNENETPFLNFCTYLHQNKVFINAFISSMNWPEVTSIMYRQAFTVYKNNIVNEMKVPLKDLANYIVGAHIQLIRSWLNGGDSLESPAIMAQHLTKLTRDGLLNGLGLTDKVALPD